MANLASFKGCESFYGQSPAKWRSGIKHDCSRGMELFPDQKRFRNGFGRSVSLEPALLYPMLKSSEMVKKVPSPSRFMLVTQTRIGEDTSRISRDSPWTWSYLEEYGSYLDGRSSSVYRNRARFPMFGVGPYAFASWKVAISGFYKDIQFRAIGPRDGKPVVFDDTCYFLPCQTEGEAPRVLPGVLESEMAREFFGAPVFPDAERPVTASILGSLNLDILAAKLNLSLAEFLEVLNENRMAYRDLKQYRKWRFHAK